MTFDYELGEDFARQLDSTDPLASFREQFLFPMANDGNEAIYLCGNSLGLMPKRARDYVNAELDSWAKYGVEGHFEGNFPWLSYHELVTDDLATLTGALPHEVVAMNTLSVNLHLMMISFYRPTPARNKIIMGFNPFPSDRYAVASQVRLRDFIPAEAIIEVVPATGGVEVQEEDIEAILDQHGEEVSLVLLEGVNYYTGQALDIARIAKKAHCIGAMFGVDLAHAMGNIPLRLHDWRVDFAVWCSYKYLNGGPGCIAGAFVHEKHATASLPRLCGWWGHDKATRFKMGPEFQPIHGAEGWQLSNPPILPLAALRASLELFRNAGVESLRQKSIKLTGYLEYLIHESCGEKVTIFTPANPEARGAQLSLRVQGGKGTFEKLSERGVICDWREPDVIRLAPAPLYNSFLDVYRCCEALKEAV